MKRRSRQESVMNECPRQRLEQEQRHSGTLQPLLTRAQCGQRGTGLEARFGSV